MEFFYNSLFVQKHLGCKKVRDQSEAACKQAGATKSFDISWGQEVTLSKILTLNDIHTFLSRLALSLGHLYNNLSTKKWPSDKTNFVKNML